MALSAVFSVWNKVLQIQLQHWHIVLVGGTIVHQERILRRVNTKNLYKAIRVSTAHIPASRVD